MSAKAFPEPIKLTSVDDETSSTQSESSDVPMPNTFEGPEKNLEIDFKANVGHVNGFREVTRAELDEMLDAAKCQILSKTSNEYIDSYVLSESSLFVYARKVVIKTCGTTTLLKCIPFIKRYADRLGLEIEWVSYSRKNYSFPDDQQYPHTSFQTEVAYLNGYFPDGTAHVLGPLNHDHWYIYVWDAETHGAEPDNSATEEAESTLHILMQDMHPTVAQRFFKKDSSMTSRQMTIDSGIRDLVPSAVIDDFAFDPCGYSMNGILFDAYYTIHITPESHCSYVSFETNARLRCYESLVKNVIRCFRPARPKFAMASGEFVNILYHTDVTRYLEFRQIEGSFVYRDGKISKVPANEKEALLSPLMGLFEKRRAKSFFEFIQKYDFTDPSTHNGLDLNVVTMTEVYKKFGLEPGTQDFIGHALALHLDDSYMNKPARDTYERICLYMNSIARYGKSPYIYPLYGLGELPQGFARLSAIHGGTYMLAKSIDEIVMEDGKFAGVKSGGETAKAKAVIGDPSYFPDKVKKVGQVVRIICFLNHPVPNTGDADSVQLVIPQNQVQRKHDIYVAAVSSAHNVCGKDYFVAIVSTIVETATPEKECDAGLALLGSIQERFVEVKDLYEPISDGTDENIFISNSYDSTSHFETTCADVKSIYKRVTGNELKVEGMVEKMQDQ